NVDPLGRPLLMDGTNWQQALKLLDGAAPKAGANTPLAWAIRDVLAKGRAKEFWPEDFTGLRTLIVLTDGEDNWGAIYKNDPGSEALKALKGTPDDVNLHIVFFGMSQTKLPGETETEEKRALKQFDVLRREEHFRDPIRTPAGLHSGVRDAETLAKECK